MHWMIMTRVIKYTTSCSWKSGCPEKGQLWQKLHPCPPDFLPTMSQHVAQWTLRSQERECSLRDYTGRFLQVFHLQLVNTTSWLREATLVVHVVNQILLQMLGAKQMRWYVENIKIHIGELVPLTSFTLCFVIFRVFHPSFVSFAVFWVTEQNRTLNHWV